MSVRPCRPGGPPVVTIDTAPGTLRIALRNSAALNDGLSGIGMSDARKFMTTICLDGRIKLIDGSHSRTIYLHCKTG